MEELLQNIDWLQVLGVVWSVILLPIINYAKNRFEEWARERKLEKYSALLLAGVDQAVKDLYTTVVEDIKGTDEWTPEKQQEILEMAKKKVIISLTSIGYNVLQEASEDVDAYIEMLIQAKLYDLKHQR